jgi:hypothetical protein
MRYKLGLAMGGCEDALYVCSMLLRADLAARLLQAEMGERRALSQ